MRPVPPESDSIMSARFASDAEIAIIKRAAAALGLNPSAFIRLASLDKARATIDEEPGTLRKRSNTKLQVIEGGKKPQAPR